MQESLTYKQENNMQVHSHMVAKEKEEIYTYRTKKEINY